MNLTLGQEAASWGKRLKWAQSSLAQLVRRCTLPAPHTTQEGFCSRCTTTLCSYTLLPGSQPASPYGQLFLHRAAHSERHTVKSIIVPTEPNLHIQDHLQYESRYPGLLHLTSFLAKLRKWDRPGSQTVLLLCCQEERQWELTWVPHSHTWKGFLSIFLTLIKFLEKNEVCRSYSNLLSPKGLYYEFFSQSEK